MLIVFLLMHQKYKTIAQTKEQTQWFSFLKLHKIMIRWLHRRIVWVLIISLLNRWFEIFVVREINTKIFISATLLGGRVNLRAICKVIFYSSDLKVSATERIFSTRNCYFFFTIYNNHRHVL